MAMYIAQRKDPYIIFQCIRSFSWVDDIEHIQYQIVQCDAHRAANFRRIHALELESDASSLADEEEIKFGTAVNCIEVSTVRTEYPQDPWHDESRSLRMPEKKG